MAVRLQRVSVGASVEFNPLDVGTTLPSFFIRDTAEPTGVRKVDAMAAESGRWVAPTNAVDGVMYSYPDAPFPHLLWFPKFTGSDLRAYVTAYEHPNPQPAPSPPPNVMINVGLTTPFKIGEDFAIDVIGAWVRYAVPPPPPPPPPPGVGAVVLANNTSYSAFTPFVAVPGGAAGQITAQDVVALVRYETVAGVRTLTGHLSLPPLDQTSDPIAVSGTLIPVGAGQYQSLAATITAGAVASRFGAQMPGVPPPTQSWRIEAAPGYAVGLPVGLLLAEGPVAPDATTIGATYANPFSAQWRPTIRYLATSQRSVTIGSATAVMSSSLQAIAEATTSQTLEMAAGLPTMTAINNMPLTTDGATLSLDVAGPVYVDITADRTPNTLYEITVVEMTAVGTQITRTPVAVVKGIESRLQLPPGAVQRGRTYSLHILCTAGGYTKAAAGDLQAFALPVSRGYQEGAVFTVAP